MSFKFKTLVLFIKIHKNLKKNQITAVLNIVKKEDLGPEFAEAFFASQSSFKSDKVLVVSC